jgi:HD superfamily phosphohydrolase
MFLQVYFHKTRRYLDHLLIEGIASVLEKGIYPKETKEYLEYDDNAIWKLLEKNANNSAISDLINRNLKTCVYETKVHGDVSSNRDFNRMLKKLKEKGLGNEIFEDQATKAPHKLPQFSNGDEGNPSFMVIRDNMEEPEDILSVSILLKSLNEQINIKRIYVSQDYKADAQKIVKDNI